MVHSFMAFFEEWLPGMFTLLICLFLLVTVGIASAADVSCCKVCCKGSQCIMTHGATHDCVGHPPCK